MGDTGFGSLMNELGVWPDLQTSIEGALSGARVVPVRHRAGTPAVLKLTTETDGDARQAAERELRFYRELQGSIGIGAPRLLAHREDDDFIAIVLTRHAAPRSATRWSQQNWIELAIDLATLHETPVGTDRGWGCPSSLMGLPDAPDLEVARAFWSWPGEPDLIEPILGDLQALHEAIRQPERCSLHGDCHSDNVLIERDQLIWVDWQTPVWATSLRTRVPISSRNTERRRPSHPRDRAYLRRPPWPRLGHTPPSRGGSRARNLPGQLAALRRLQQRCRHPARTPTSTRPRRHLAHQQVTSAGTPETFARDEAAHASTGGWRHGMFSMNGSRSGVGLPPI